MKRKETNAEASAPSTGSAARITRNLSVREAKTFWQNQRKEGNVDVLFKEVQSKVQLLWQKIKDGSATNQDYVTALMLVNDTDLENYKTHHCVPIDQSFSEEKLEDTDCIPLRTEEPSPMYISNELEEPLPCSEPESDVPPPSVATSLFYEKHSCGQKCVSNVNPYFNRRENPLKFPVICHFQRRHAKSSLISRHLDVIYKAPCGKSLRDFDDVRSYLSQTECSFLSLDHFSFNTYIQLDRNLVKNQVVFQEADISKDAELVPIPYCNEIDSARPAPFTYRKSPWPRGYSINNFTDLFSGCCDCTDGCLDVSKCACLQLTAKGATSQIKSKAPGYKYKRLQTPMPTGLYECNVSCKCDRKMCENRVVQHGLQLRLQVFKTKEKGWGVRCQDDLDRGTFVCIYAGRILMKTVDVKNTADLVTHTLAKTISITPRKRCCSHSDSEITEPPSVSGISQKFRIKPVSRGRSQTESKRKSLSHIKDRKLDFRSIKRPQTKTSILQKRTRQLMEEGAVTMPHSSDEELVTPTTSPKKRYSGDCEDKEEDVKMIDTTMDDHVLDDEASCVSDESNSSVQSGSEENSSPQNDKESIYFLDASTEGNVGRFLNHSCSPNLFVQHVFVETHYKKFPWVAFFTKCFIKAGTELTWDYNYDIGSVPEEEISCLCGHKTCKNIVI